MPIVSSIFLVVALVLGVTIGSQTRSWPWGPSMLALGLATLAAIPVFWRREKSPADFAFIAFATVVAGWFAVRAWLSPVPELGLDDQLLIASAVAAYICIRAIEGHSWAERVLLWGVALLLLANVVVAWQQFSDPTFTPVFKEHANQTHVTGFYPHYNDAANYFIASAMLVGAAGLFGRHATATRVIWILIAIAGLACVWFTRSRGGIFGAAVGGAVFAIVALIISKRHGSRWFAPAVVAVPLIGLAVASYLIIGWHDAQETRNAGSGIKEMMDNTIRLYLLGIAMSCVAAYPFFGGGSRSFSWECYQVWDQNAHGAGGNRPEFVHNELLQAATDYGLIGLVLLLVLLFMLAGVAIIRVLFEAVTRNSPNSRQAWRLGALAGLVGMLVQSTFSFVFHLLPGVILLGICLGQLGCGSKTSERKGPLVGTRVLLSVSALGCGLLLVAIGWKGTQVTRILWPTYFSKTFVFSKEAHIAALSEAIEIWPSAELHTARAAARQSSPAPDAAANRDLMKQVLADYQKAARYHPKDPSIALNRANLLSFFGRDAEAEAQYANAIQLQGGMETAFNAMLLSAWHLLSKGNRQMQAGATDAALATLETAAERIEDSAAQFPAWGFQTLGGPTQISIYESLGLVREQRGDLDGALQAHTTALALPKASRSIHYRIGQLHGKVASQKWAEGKSSEALASFMKARQHLAAATELPRGVSPAQHTGYLAYVDQTIAFLRAAKVVPAE